MTRRSRIATVDSYTSWWENRPEQQQSRYKHWTPATRVCEKAHVLLWSRCFRCGVRTTAAAFHTIKKRPDRFYTLRDPCNTSCSCTALVQRGSSPPRPTAVLLPPLPPSQLCGHTTVLNCMHNTIQIPHIVRTACLSGYSFFNLYSDAGFNALFMVLPFSQHGIVILAHVLFSCPRAPGPWPSVFVLQNSCRISLLELRVVVYSMRSVDEWKTTRITTSPSSTASSRQTATTSTSGT